MDTLGFIGTALIAGLITGAISALVGSYLVIRRMALFSDTIAHVSLLGVVLGTLVGVVPLFGALVSAVVATLGLERMRNMYKGSIDALLAMLLSGSLALSVVLVSTIHSGKSIQFMSYLFGSILTVTPQELGTIIILGIVIFIVILMYHKELFAITFDEDMAFVEGVPVKRMNTIFMVLTAVAVALNITVVGALLTGALMVLPVMGALQLKFGFRKTQVFAIIFAELAVVLGLLASLFINIPAGASIVLASIGIFVLALFYRYLFAV